jgi:tetratricopeptide (TPR) repeat protein
MASTCRPGARTGRREVKHLKRKPDLQNIHFAIGSLHWKNQKFDEARKELQLELRTDPNHAQAIYELGDICAFNGRTQDAEKYFLEALKLEPAMVEAHLGLEKIYTASGRYEKSIDRLRAVLRADSSDPTAHCRLALVRRERTCYLQTAPAAIESERLLDRQVAVGG